MSNKITISGVSIVRNALKLGYPLTESIESVLDLCDEFLINCGKSEDGTEKLCEQIAAKYPHKVKLHFTHWNQRPASQGEELSFQTNEMIKKCQGDWIFYIQADEVFHESGREQVLKAIGEANRRQEVEGLLFDYRHFYTSYDYEIRGRNWYRKEVRLFKNHRGVQSFRDAQGFRCKEKKIKALNSHAEIFHYGYVRNPESMKTKSQEMSQFWQSTASTDVSKMQPVNHVGLSRFKGSHPQVMDHRIQTHAPDFVPSQYPRKFDKQEIKNILNLFWEKCFGFRLGEFKNYELLKD